MSSDFFLVVNQNVARNPVARAVQRNRIAREVRTFQILLHNLPDGSEQADNIQAAARVVAVAIRNLEVAGKLDSTAGKVMRGGMSAMEDRARHGFRWRTQDAIPVDLALKHALAVILAASSAETTDAWRFVVGLERAAREAA